MNEQIQKNYPGIRRNPDYDAWELNPKPSEEEIGEFYLSKYYELLKAGGRASSLRRRLEGGAEAERERAWLDNGLHADVEAFLAAHAPGRRVLDIGCGCGDFIAFLDRKGYQTQGLEPSELAAEVAQARRVNVLCADFEAFLADHAQGEDPGYDAVVMLHVLEHVPNAREQLERAATMLVPGGVVAIAVPNDFNPLQDAAVKTHDLPSWWIARPDHISYFSHKSLASLLDLCGFDVLDATTTFPMELFLLMGKIYVDNPQVGGECHAMRQAFEFSLPTDVRRRFYRLLTEIGWGRDCVMVGRLR